MFKRIYQWHASETTVMQNGKETFTMSETFSIAEFDSILYTVIIILFKHENIKLNLVYVLQNDLLSPKCTHQYTKSNGLTADM